jgi:quercetin dioxygenase-like cupin family protein
MKAWDVMAMEVAPHRPEVLASTDEGRAIVVSLRSGEELGDHEVHERAWVVVTRGRVEAVAEDGGRGQAVPGTLFGFAPHERRTLRALEDSQLLMLLTPWPGPDRNMG